MRKKSFFCFLSRILSTFEQKFFRLLAKKLQKVFKTTFCPSRGTFCDFNFFVKVLNLFGFSAETLVWFSKVYLSVQSKNCGKKVFFCFFSRIFSIFEQKFFRLLAKKLQQFFKNYLLRVQRNNLWLEFFFVKFWTVSDFLQKLLAWFSKFYLRVQSKNCGKKVFFCFLSRIFFDFWAKIFQTFGQKTSTIFQKLPSTCPEEQFVARIFFCKVLNRFGFSAETLVWFSKIYLSFQSKNCGKKVFFCFLSRTFSIFEQKFFRLLAKKLQKVFKTTFYVSRGTVCGLKFLSKVLNRFGFSTETFGMVLKILTTCPE